MFAPASRRAFLKSAAGAAAVATLPQLDFLGQLPRVSAQDAKPDPKAVQLNAEIEPLVKLLEETPRNKLLEEVAAKIKGGTTYREVLSALLLAGVRNIQPRPSVGFKFHAVLVVNSAHLAAMSSPDEHRWLPIFWALDEFKGSQARDVQEGNWTMGPVNEERVPPAHLAKQQFIEAMDQWDEAKADAAAAAGPHGEQQRVVRPLLPLRAATSLDRAQGDLRRQLVADAPLHRLAARRAGPPLAGVRTP
jgi:hypothetical protein